MAARTDLTGEYECRSCRLVLPASEFNVKTATSGGRTYHFLSLDCKPCGNIRKVELLHQKRLEAYAAYGGGCVCCRETRWQFLSLDHKDDDGAAHRRGAKTTHLFMWARRHGYPDTLQLMCLNCNIGRFRNGGTCPHQLEPSVADAG